MKPIRILTTISLMFLFMQCNTNKSENKTEPPTGVPPSLSEAIQNSSLIKLTEKEQGELKIETTVLKREFTDYTVLAPGVVFPAPDHASIISVPINGQVSRIMKHEGAMVSKDEPLFYIQSLEFGTMISEYLQAFAEERYQGNRLNRLQQLVSEKISSESELEQASSDHQRTLAMLKASVAKLKAIGVTEKEIAGFTNSENIEPVLKIYSPIDGVIEKNFIEPGQSVNALEKLSRILDTRVVLIRAYITPDDARLLNTGDSVTVSKSESGNIIKATITSVNPGLDENSRSVVAGILVKTHGGWPKPGENLKLEISTSTQKEMISIPLESLTYDGNEPIVFVKKGNGIFEKRTVKVSEIRDINVLITSGLSENEEIAVSKIFSLKALSRFDLISEE
jgi:cobalt-zinc-cadmium efflux system membrane fusion protein